VHLIRRFFGFLFAKPLTPLEQQQIHDLLQPALAQAFFAQRSEDQRHAFEVLQRIRGSGEVAEAALLHDVGKTESDLGAVSRAVATLSAGLGLPMPDSWKSYINHGRIGSELLAGIDASALAVAFTCFHPGPAPPGIDPEQWHLLEKADNT
jgi:hypothetical protein